MSELLLGCAGMLITLLAFFIGFFTGRAVSEQPLMPERTEGRVFCPGEDSKLHPCCRAEIDREKQLRYEAEQKALADCMNYSIDVAYASK